MSSDYGALMVGDTIHEREIELADGAKRTLYFKEVPAQVFRKWIIARNSEDDAVRAASAEILIVASMCEPDGKPALTLEQAARLKPVIASRLFDAVLEINGGANEKKAEGQD